MKIVIAADIHGTNDRLRLLLHGLGELTLVSPWSGDGQPYGDEQQAVAAFHARDGLASYAHQIAQVVRGEPALLIGFSVGASSLWRYIASTQCNTQSHAILYYGSRIRDSLALVPRCPASVVFAEHEHSFLPHTIAPLLAPSGVKCTVMAGTRHGFMNPMSAHFRADIAQQQLALIKDLLNADPLRAKETTPPSPAGHRPQSHA